MSPEEVIPYFYPQIYNIADMNLSEEVFPEVSTTQRFFPDFDIFSCDLIYAA